MSRIPTRATTPAITPQAMPDRRPGPMERSDREREIVSLLAACREQFADVMGLEPDDPRLARFLAACIACYRDAPESSKVRIVDARSFVGACVLAARAGLVPDGDLGYIGEEQGAAVWLPSWRGLVAVMRRAVKAEGGRVHSFAVELVYRQEVKHGGFDVDYAARTIRHRPYLVLPEMFDQPAPTEADVVCCYAACTIVDRDGNESREFRVLTRRELEDREEGSRFPDTWHRHRNGMQRKSTVRALLDWLPKPDDLRDALRDDGTVYEVVDPTPPASLAAARASALNARAREAARLEPAAEPTAAPEPFSEPANRCEPSAEWTDAAVASGLIREPDAPTQAFADGRAAVEAVRRRMSPLGEGGA